MNFLTVIVFVACFAALRPSGTTPRRLEFLTEIVVVGMRHVPFERYDCPYENTGQTYFRVGCNMCECNRGDLVNCTKYRCSPDGSIAPAPEVECVDFEVKWDDCSVCFCRNETWRCVPKPCNKAKNKRSISGKNLDAFYQRKFHLSLQNLFASSTAWENTKSATNASASRRDGRVPRTLASPPEERPIVL